MAIATSLHRSSDRVNPQAQVTEQPKVKLLKSRWSGGRAYLPILRIVLLLGVSVAIMRIHGLGLTLLRSLRGGIRLRGGIQ